MAKTTISKERERMLNSAIAYLRVKGYHEIKAPFKSFPTPQSVFRKASEAGFVPDMIAEKDFGTFIFEVLDDESLSNWDDRLPKWQLFDEYCERKKGKFYFIAYSDEAEAIAEKLETLDIKPGIIRIKR
ncbi:hypothetical protein O3Q51_05015 [Cryomorphaceae bacterium 1068]|nr:hypothetical protein [Cryomorphaceae bacterium 1068]